MLTPGRMARLPLTSNPFLGAKLTAIESVLENLKKQRARLESGGGAEEKDVECSI